MKEKDLWEYFLCHQIVKAHPHDRDLIWVSVETFEKVKEYFFNEWNVVHAGGSYRSRSYLKHVHAVYQGEMVMVHMDTGNIARSFPLGIIHLFFDVIPYLIISITTGKSVESLFMCPSTKDK